VSKSGDTIIQRTRITIQDTPQPAQVTTTLDHEIPRGTPVRLTADSLRSVMSGFVAERVSLEGQEGDPWPVLGERIPRPMPDTGVQQGPRQVLLVQSPGVAAGQRVTVAGTFSPAGAGYGPSLAPYAETSITFRLEVARVNPQDPASAWDPVSDWFGFALEAGAPDHLEAFIDTAGNVAVGLFDKDVNPVAGSGETVEVILPDGSVATGSLGQSGQTGTAYGATRIPLPGEVAAGTRVTVRDSRGREAVSSPAPVRSAEGEQLLFGEFHWHTEASGDGCRPLPDAYRSARDGLLLDYVGAADHFPFDPPRRPGMPLTEYAGIAGDYDAPGQFVTLLGVELSWRMGHYNFYWADREELDLFVDAWEARERGPLAGTVLAPDIASFYGLSPQYFERAHPERLLVIPHHTNVTSAQLYTPSGLPVWTHYHWPLGHYDPRFFRLAEIVQGRGCFESEEVDPDWKVRTGAAGGSVRTGLARGFRVGFTGGTDNHNGWPGRQTGGWVGLTAVYAEEFSRAGIMRGLYRRRCYATTGVRIVADFRLNGEPMGSELLLEPRGTRRFTVRVHGTAPLDRVEIVSQGTVIAQLSVDGPDLVTEWVDERPTRPVHDFYYYLRIRQQDGHCAWTSPIWGDLAHPKDIATAYGGPVAWS
jgi:hypothetical protein